MKAKQSQGGFALLIFVILLIGMGGLVFAGFSQQLLKDVNESRLSYNRDVLERAKQALLLYVYRYPNFNAQGVGRLPCPYDQLNGYSGSVSAAICDAVGRFPRLNPDLNFEPEAKDASGEYLWYAVSEEFRNVASSDVGANTNGDTVVNSASIGTISIFDQTGALVYDGNANGIAAVIIAPGAPITRDNDGNGTYEYTQVRGTPAQQNDPVNYLDTFNNFDNSAFLNAGSNDADGFILGPVRETDPNSPAHNSIVVNDQIIIITAAEVIEMAEKAVLESYRNAINDYLANTGNVYPWLYNYQGVPGVAGLSSFFPADAIFANELANNLDNFGRIPSIFANYFTDTDSQSIESDLSGTIVFGYPPTPTKVDHSGGGGDFEFAAGATHTLNFQTANLIDVRFVDLPLDNGRLAATIPVVEPIFNQTVYFWENQSSGNGFWTICAPPADTLDDCNRDSSGNLTAGLNDFDSEILKITINLNFNPGPILFNVDYSFLPNPILAGPIFTAATNTAHANVSVTYDGGAIDSIALSPFLSAAYEIDDAYDAGDLTFSATDSGTLDDITQLNINSVELGIRYYPELPGWVFDNDWHSSVIMAYANDYRPDIAGASGDCVANPPCLVINGLAGVNNDKVSLLVLAGEHGWVDGDVIPVKAPDGDFGDELGDVFNLENADSDNVFDNRTVENTGAPGDIQLDKIMLIR